MTLAAPWKSAVLAASLIVAAPAAHATIARAIPFDQKVENASSIVVGKVVSQRAAWDASKRWIVTYSSLRIEKTLKGNPAQEITIVTPGGTVDNVRQETIGVPRLREGEDHVIFVRPTASGPTLLYFEQGDYRVSEDDRGDRVVNPAMSAAVYVDTQRGSAVAAERPRKLAEFERQVKESVRRQEAVRMEMMERQRAEASSLGNQLKRNWPLIALALLGAAIATWQLVRRW